MAKKKGVKGKKAGKSVKKGSGKNEKPRKNRWVGIAVIVVVFALILFLFSYSAFFSGRKASTFGEAVQMVEEIDSAHNISFSDYQRGLYYLEDNPRYPNPLNFDEMEVVLEEYDEIRGDGNVELFTDFRINLLEAEKYYRLSQKSYKADLHNYGLRCKNEPYILESINNTGKSVENIREMLANLDELNEKYPEDFNSLNISGEWIKIMANEIIDLEAEASYKKAFFNNFCNETND